MSGGSGGLAAKALLIFGALAVMIMTSAASPLVISSIPSTGQGNEASYVSGSSETARETIREGRLWALLEYTPGLVLGAEAFLRDIEGRQYPVVVVNATQCLSLVQLYRGDSNLSVLPLVETILERERLRGGLCMITLDFSKHPSSWLYLDEDSTLKALLGDEAGTQILQVTLRLEDTGLAPGRHENGESEPVNESRAEAGDPDIDATVPPEEPTVVGTVRGAGGFKLSNITLTILAFLVVAALVADVARTRARGSR